MKEIKRTKMVLQKIKLKTVWNGTDKKTKIRILRAFIFPVATYGCEAWTFNKAVEKHISAFEYVLQKSPSYILDREENK